MPAKMSVLGLILSSYPSEVCDGTVSLFILELLSLYEVNNNSRSLLIFNKFYFYFTNNFLAAAHIKQLQMRIKLNCLVLKNLFF